MANIQLLNMRQVQERINVGRSTAFQLVLSGELLQYRILAAGFPYLRPRARLSMVSGFHTTGTVDRPRLITRPSTTRIQPSRG
jgi:hypothetical protein